MQTHAAGVIHGDANEEAVSLEEFQKGMCESARVAHCYCMCVCFLLWA